MAHPLFREVGKIRRTIDVVNWMTILKPTMLWLVVITIELADRRCHPLADHLLAG